jgi:WD40 repeat protein/energy-coupling factor transporter ATP-binding protein EcfA2/flagellar biosynthesis GTPase FlhF
VKEQMMQEIDRTANPFPGLRPFESSETHLFFGRDGQSEELLRRLKRTRFLAVVGTSGSGKSSLVRAGLLPALQGGLMASAGSDWRIAILRPGSDPIGNLARAFASPAVFGASDEKGAAMQAVMAETTLRRSSLGLVDLVTRARTKVTESGRPVFADYENLLVVVDQFEELFRFKQLIEEENSHEDAAAFVKLLLEAVRQNDEQKIYVVLTMRSDFLGDCSQFFELPEAINNGQYLIPRLTRDERRAAISGPVAVGQGAISEPLVNQLLNDVGDNPDQLPILQHALMRTWDHWLGHRNGNPIDIPDYDAIGGMASALSRHADEAYAELNERQKAIAEKLFKGLTEKGTDNREIRRPMEVQEICALTGASEAAVIAVVEVFRREGRSFLMPPPNDPLTGAPVRLNGESLIDISHESLIRNWERLKNWVDEESRSARIYRRLAETAVLHKEGGAGLWRDPDLGVALTWREQSNPNEVWAKRYHPEFPLAMSFLDQSVTARDAQLASEEARRKREINRTRLTALVCVLGFLISTGMGVYAYTRKLTAENALADAQRERDRAQQAQKDADTQRKAAEAAELIAVGARAKANEQAEDAKKSAAAAVAAQNEAKRNAEDAKRAASDASIARDEAQQNETVAFDAGKMAIAKAAENRRLLYSSDVGLAQTAFEENDSTRAQELLNRYKSVPPKAVLAVGGTKHEFNAEDLRGYEWYYLWRLVNRKLETLKLSDTPTTAAEDRPASASLDYVRPVTPVAYRFGIFATSGSDKVVRLWSRPSLQKSPTMLPAFNEPVTSVALANDHNFYLAVGGPTTVEFRPLIYNRAGGVEASEVTHTIKLKGASDHTALGFSLGSPRYLAVGNAGTFILWDRETNKEFTLVESDKGYASVAFVDSDKSLITCDGKKLTRWDVATRQPTEIKLLVDDDDDDEKPFITSFAFPLDRKTMVTNGRHSFTVWTAANDEGTAYKPRAILPAHKSSVLLRTQYNLVVAVSPDGKLMATGDGTDLKNDGGVKLWDLSADQPKELFTLSPDVADARSLAFSDDARTLAVVARDEVQFWDAGPKEPFTSRAQKGQMIFALDQKSWVEVGADTVTRWILGSDKPHKDTWSLRSFAEANPTNRATQPTAVAVANGGNLLATRQRGKLKIWDVRSAQPKLQATIYGDVDQVAFSPDGNTIATASMVEKVEWWKVDKDESRPSEDYGDTSYVRAMAFSADGEVLAVGGGFEAATSGLVTLWNAKTEKHERWPHQIQGPKGIHVDVTSLAFSPKSHILAVGGSDKTVNLWNVDTGLQMTHPLEAHKFPVTSVAFSPDGKTIASGDSGGIVNVWSASTYQWMLELKASSEPINSIAFTADGQSLFTNDRNGEIREWRTAPREPVNAPSGQSTKVASTGYLDLHSSGAGKTNPLRALASDDVILRLWPGARVMAAARRSQASL